MGTQQDGRTLLRAVKAAAWGEAPFCLVVGQPVEAILRPVATREGFLCAADVRALTEWRNRFVQAFLTEFEANVERTEHWLTRMVGPDDTRILFMLDDVGNGKTVGYMGLAYIDWDNGSGEADAIVRGEQTSPGLMTRAMRTMLNWARHQLGLSLLGVRVRSDNTAVEYYRKFGFNEVRRVPLRRIDRRDMIQWIEDETLPAGEPSLVHMVLTESAEAPQSRMPEVAKEIS